MGSKKDIKSSLVIVESPAKCKTITKYLGPGYTVLASYGHVADLPSKGLGIDIKNNFTPEYAISPDKKKVIQDLKKVVQSVDQVYIATDEDREGEAIGWHICNALHLDSSTTPRIVFHEITQDAITKAINNPRYIDTNLVDAQQARRIVDRLVGYEISPVLRRKVKTGLSAGRVQSVAVRIIVARELEIQKFAIDSSFKISGDFTTIRNDSFVAKCEKDFGTQKDAQDFLTSCQSSDFIISTVSTKPSKKSSSPPFTTSTLQQEASRKLGYGVSKTMQLAQRLYEAGYITYMRTDAVNISQTAVGQAQQMIEKEYGSQYAKPTFYKGKAKGAQEAHECIRPTNFSARHLGADPQQKKLYELIRKRAIASQMSDALIDKTKAHITGTKTKYGFIAEGERITFDGFLKVYSESYDDDDFETKNMLTQLNEHETIQRKKIGATETFKNHPPRYSEASLVKKLEELGIGRPSTYAPTISTIQKRGYVIKDSREGESKKYIELVLSKKGIQEQEKIKMYGADKNKLFPTDIGMLVTEFLLKNFPDILDYNFTASLESEFDEIAGGNIAWQKMIDTFYRPFHASVSATLDGAERVSGERALGSDPVSGKPVIARMGKYGPLVQIGEKDDEEKTFAPIQPPHSIMSITLDQALHLFRLPRKLGLYNEKDISVAIGRFGPYIKWGNMFVSIKANQGDDPYTITYDRCIEYIQEKITWEEKRLIQEFDWNGEKVRILQGRRGPFIDCKKLKIKIPKNLDPKTLKIDDISDILEAELKNTKKTTTKKKVVKKTMKKSTTKSTKKASPKKKTD